MATNANWTIIFEDKMVIKNYAEGANEGIGYKINDDAFWATTAFQNIWAIQSGTSNSSDEVEHRDGTSHCSLADEGPFISVVSHVHQLGRSACRRSNCFARPASHHYTRSFCG